MEDLIKAHKKKHGVAPVVIGRHWSNQDIVIVGIIEAINGDNPYDEYEELTDEEKIAYDAGDLLF